MSGRNKNAYWAHLPLRPTPLQSHHYCTSATTSTRSNNNNNSNPQSFLLPATTNSRSSSFVSRRRSCSFVLDYNEPEELEIIRQNTLVDEGESVEQTDEQDDDEVVEIGFWPETQAILEDIEKSRRRPYLAATTLTATTSTTTTSVKVDEKVRIVMMTMTEETANNVVAEEIESQLTNPKDNNNNEAEEGQEALWVEEDVAAATGETDENVPYADKKTLKKKKTIAAENARSRMKRNFFRSKKSTKEMAGKSPKPHSIVLLNEKEAPIHAVTTELGGHVAEDIPGETEANNINGQPQAAASEDDDEQMRLEMASKILTARKLLAQALASSVGGTTPPGCKKAAFAQALEARQLAAEIGTKRQGDTKKKSFFGHNNKKHAKSNIAAQYEKDISKALESDDPDFCTQLLETILPEVDPSILERARNMSISPLVLDTKSSDEISSLGFMNGTFEEMTNHQKKSNNNDINHAKSPMSMSSLNEILDGPLSPPKIPQEIVSKSKHLAGAELASAPLTTEPMENAEPTTLPIKPKGHGGFLGFGGGGRRSKKSSQRYYGRKNLQRFQATVQEFNDNQDDDKELEPPDELEQFVDLDRQLSARLKDAMDKDETGSLTSMEGVPVHEKIQKKKDKKKSKSKKLETMNIEEDQANEKHPRRPVNWEILKPNFVTAPKGEPALLMTAKSWDSLMLEEEEEKEARLNLAPEDIDATDSESVPPAAVMPTKSVDEDKYTVAAEVDSPADKYTVLTDPCSLCGSLWGSSKEEEEATPTAAAVDENCMVDKYATADAKADEQTNDVIPAVEEMAMNEVHDASTSNKKSPGRLRGLFGKRGDGAPVDPAVPSSDGSIVEKRELLDVPDEKQSSTTHLLQFSLMPKTPPRFGAKNKNTTECSDDIVTGSENVTVLPESQVVDKYSSSALIPDKLTYEDVFDKTNTGESVPTTRRLRISGMLFGINSKQSKETYEKQELVEDAPTRLVAAEENLQTEKDINSQNRIKLRSPLWISKKSKKSTSKEMTPLEMQLSTIKIAETTSSTHPDLHDQTLPSLVEDSSQGSSSREEDDQQQPQNLDPLVESIIQQQQPKQRRGRRGVDPATNHSAMMTMSQRGTLDP